ncbi:TRAP transporter small permease [Chloroflexota bacterium]
MFAKSVDGVLCRIEKWFSVVGALAVVLIMAGVATQIVARYAFNEAFAGIYEGSELLIVVVVFLSLSYIQSIRSHISMDFVVNRLPKRVQRGVSIVVLTLAFALFVVVTIRSGSYAYEQWDIGAASMGVIDFPLWPSRVFVPIGTALISLRLLYQIIFGLPPQAEERNSHIKGVEEK